MSGLIRRVQAFRAKVNRLQNGLELLGPQGIRALRKATRGAAAPDKDGIRIPSRLSAQPILVRATGSDLTVLRSIAIEREYGCLDHLPNPEVIVDCGANIGLASLYFLALWPNARLIAVEPDPDNVAIARHNLAPFGDRATVVHAGIWSHTCDLVIEERPYRDGEMWTRQVREVRPGESGTFRGISIPDLLDQYQIDRVSVLKIDIEGAEVFVLRASQDWIDRFDCLALELHDDSHFGNATEALEAAIAGRGFSVRHSGDTTICERRRS